MSVANCSAKVRLTFRAEKLPDKDTFSKSDPYLVLYNAPGGARGAAIGRTEVVKNNLSPSWESAVCLDYFFEAKQEFIAVVYDFDGHKNDAENDLLGSVSFQLAHVMGARGNSLRRQLNGGTDVSSSASSVLVISAEEIGANGRDILGITLAARGLKKMDTFGSSDPYFKIHRLLPGGSKKQLYQSEVIKNTLDPKWNPVPRLLLDQVAGADLSHKTLNIELFDSDMFSDDYMGEVTCSVAELLASAAGAPLEILKPAKPHKRGYGQLFCTTAKITHRPTFVEFLASGWQINLAVAIDFTGSNGDPRNPRSLHFMDPVNPNQYVRAIMSVTDVLMAYDYDQLVPAFGFGAMLPNGQVSHFFHLNDQPSPYVHGVQGVLDAYGRALATTRLAGPTNFAPTITNVASGARKAPNVYTVLLILTDGEITDVDATIDAMVNADDAPLSIVIVGVGDGCDFKQMTILDGDNQVLKSTTGKASRRDIVQFVPFRDFVFAPPGALAAEVLREIPEQLVKWAELVGAAPLRTTGAAAPPPVPSAAPVTRPPADLDTQL